MNLPFSIDRSSRIKLPYQVADGLRSAIQSGVWKPGERIPSSRELKEALGVSVRAPMEALQLLAAEGLITLREKCGAVVASARSPLIKGRILLIVPGGAQVRSISVLMENVRRKLNAAGYLVVTTSVLREKEFVDDDSDPYDLRQLEYDLKMSYSLVLLFGAPPWTDGIVRLLSTAKYPFLIAGGPAADASSCVGGILFESSAAVTAFAEHCRHSHIRRVTVVRKWRSDGRNVAAALRAVGAKVDFMTVPQQKGRGRPESLWETTFAAFERSFAQNGNKWLPDLLYFTDDHCFQGAVMSLMTRRIRVPRDVRIVTSTNCGMRPPFYCSIACLENDLEAQAEVISRAMLDFLDLGCPVAERLTFGSTYIAGETFP
jgi:DNA-binding LacI/PurR family transcriptional regulator